MDSIKLDDLQWREDNIDTLEEWHPAFHLIYPRLQALMSELKDVMKEYRDILLSGDYTGSEEELFNHVNYEVTQWVGNMMDKGVTEVWGPFDQLDHKPSEIFECTPNTNPEFEVHPNF